jgi:hypothetical protein
MNQQSRNVAPNQAHPFSALRPPIAKEWESDGGDGGWLKQGLDQSQRCAFASYGNTTNHRWRLFFISLLA